MTEPRSLQRATIDDVALRAGVSTATVSRFINGTARLSDQTAQRVRDAISALKYVPHAAARALASSRTNTIGLILPELSAEFFPPLLRGIESVTRQAGYDLLVYSTGERIESSFDMRRPLGEQNTDGLLIFADSLPPDELQRYHDAQFPIVLLLETPRDGIEIPSVVFENKSGARQLVEHLIKVHGCRRIVFLQGPDGNQDSYWREQGYRSALERQGIPFDPTLIARGNFDEQDARAAVMSLLVDGLQFDAVFAGDDESAIGAITALNGAGLRVPEFIAVVGFDDVPISRYFNPPLTTIRAPITAAGQIAAEQLLATMQTGSAESKLLPTELIIRRSCGCAA